MKNFCFCYRNGEGKESRWRLQWRLDEFCLAVPYQVFHVVVSYKIDITFFKWHEFIPSMAFRRIPSNYIGFPPIVLPCKLDSSHIFHDFNEDGGIQVWRDHCID